MEFIVSERPGNIAKGVKLSMGSQAFTFTVQIHLILMLEKILAQGIYIYVKLSCVHFKCSTVLSLIPQQSWWGGGGKTSPYSNPWTLLIYCLIHSKTHFEDVTKVPALQMRKLSRIN